MISRPKPQDLAAIQHLLASHGKATIGPEHINRRDIALVARDADKIVGFIWAGLMAGNKIAFVDKFTVAPAYFKRGVGAQLCAALFLEGEKRGVLEVQGIIRRDQYHEASAMNALKCAWRAEDVPCTYVYGHLPEMRQEIQKLHRSIA